MRETRPFRIAVFLWLGFLLLSCGEEAMTPPEQLIPKDEMVVILTDLTLLNAAKVTNISVLQKHGVKPMSYIFNKYDIDSIRFVESNRYYASLPLVYENMHIQIKDRIEAQQEIILEAKKENDSLKLIEREAKKKKKTAKTNKAKTKSKAIKNAQE